MTRAKMERKKLRTDVKGHVGCGERVGVAMASEGRGAGRAGLDHPIHELHHELRDRHD